MVVMLWWDSGVDLEKCLTVEPQPTTFAHKPSQGDIPVRSGGKSNILDSKSNLETAPLKFQGEQQDEDDKTPLGRDRQAIYS